MNEIIEGTAVEIPAEPVEPPTQREVTIKALRDLADWLAERPDVPVSWHWIKVYGGPTAGGDPVKVQAAQVATAMRAADKNYATNTFRLSYELPDDVDAGYEWTADRKDVCTPKVVGQKTVTIAAKPAQPAEPERTEVVDEIEWECEPLALARKEQTQITEGTNG